MAFTLWTRHLRHNPRNPNWPGRDRFVLSGGHGSMLLYSLLHLTGYDLPLEELKNFRQWGSKTPGHPEFTLTPGVETTTGPLGQGFGSGVGMAIAALAFGFFDALQIQLQRVVPLDSATKRETRVPILVVIYKLKQPRIHQP